MHKRTKLWAAPFLFLGIFVFLCQCCAGEDGARQYVDLSVTQVQKIMAIISKTNVQADLHLTTNQLAEIAAFRQRRPKDIPALTNLLAQVKVSDKETRKRLEDELWKRVDEYLLDSLSNVLTSIQSARLQEIVWQVDGLKSLDNSKKLVTAIGLTQEQVKQVRDVFVFYEPILTPLYRRLGRQMVAGLSADETVQSREEQVQSLMGAIIAIEKERDRDLRYVLRPAQREVWHHLIGKPIELHWEPELF
jgi:formate dehydrogenase maturation protein FdhE